MVYTRVWTIVDIADKLRSLAWIEMRMVLASLLFEFDLLGVELSSADWIDRQKIFFLWQKLPLNIRIRPRTAGR